MPDGKREGTLLDGGRGPLPDPCEGSPCCTWSGREAREEGRVNI